MQEQKKTDPCKWGLGKHGVRHAESNYGGAIESVWVYRPDMQYIMCVFLAIFSVYCRCTPIIGIGGRKHGRAAPDNSCGGQLSTVISLILCDRLSNKYHKVHVTNKHPLLFHFFSSLQGDVNRPHVAFRARERARACPLSTSRCRFPYKYVATGIFEHECKNQLNGEQSESDVAESRERFFLDYGVKVKPKLRKLDEASHPPTSPSITHTK